MIHDRLSEIEAELAKRAKQDGVNSKHCFGAASDADIALLLRLVRLYEDELYTIACATPLGDDQKCIQIENAFAARRALAEAERIKRGEG